MPRANWDLDEAVIDEWDRDSNYKPYTGPTPPNAVYQWRISRAEYREPTTRGKRPQLLVGMELVPRNSEEKSYAGYYAWLSAYPSSKNQFSFVPFLDAIGVTSAEFTRRTNVDEEGNIISIGKWRNDGRTKVLAQLADNEYEKDGKIVKAKQISWVGPVDGDEPSDDEDEDYAADYEDDADDEEDYDEPEPPRRSSTKRSTRTQRTAKVAATKRRRRTEPEDAEYDDDDDDF